jgi:hypothetical protein
MAAAVTSTKSPTARLTVYCICALTAPWLLIRCYKTLTAPAPPSCAASAGSDAPNSGFSLSRSWALADAVALGWLACAAAAAFVLSLSVNQNFAAVCYALVALVVGAAAVESFGLAGEEPFDSAQGDSSGDES